MVGQIREKPIEIKEKSLAILGLESTDKLPTPRFADHFKIHTQPSSHSAHSTAGREGGSVFVRFRFVSKIDHRFFG